MGGPGSGRRGAPRAPKGTSAGGQFISMHLELTGAAEAADDMDEMSKSAEKAVDSTKKLGKAVDEQTKEIEENTNANKKNKDSIDDVVSSGLSNIIYLQATTSALNQTTGGMYKFIGGMEAAGRISSETAQQWQRNARTIELLTGPLEIGLALTTIYTAVTEANTAAKGKNAAATALQTKAELGLQAALLRNPYVMLAAVLLSVIASMVVMERLFVGTTKSIDAMTDAVRRLREGIRELFLLQNPFEGMFDNFPDPNKTKLFRGLMGGD